MENDLQEALVKEKDQQPELSAGLDKSSEKEDDKTRYWPEFPGTHFIGRRG